MTSLNVPDLLVNPVELPPFLTPKADSADRFWEGVFGFYFQLAPVEPDRMPIGYWSTENIVLHTAGESNAMKYHDTHRWTQGVSAVGRLFFYPRDQPLKPMWTKSAAFISFGVTRELLEQVAGEIRPGDPEAIALRGL